MLGAEGWDDVPISSAVRASTALPMVYAPHRVKDRELVDGGIVSTTNLDIAVEAGAKFIVVVNPLVPYVNDFTKEIPTLFGTRTRRVSDMGFPKIGYQTFKLLAYQRLHEMAASWKERYPGVDIVLIEPEPDDELMFQTNILNYNSRIAVARHGFHSVTRQARRELRRLARGGLPPRHPDLGHARAQGGRALRRREGEDPRLAADPRADHRHAAAAVAPATELAHSARPAVREDRPMLRAPALPGPRLPRPLAGVRFLPPSTGCSRATAAATATSSRSTLALRPAVWSATPPRSSGSSAATRRSCTPARATGARSRWSARTRCSCSTSKEHLRTRKLLLPPFHGERMRVYGDMMRELAEAEVDDVARPARSSRCCPRCSALTLRIILRTVFGARGGRADGTSSSAR